MKVHIKAISILALLGMVINPILASAQSFMGNGGQSAQIVESTNEEFDYSEYYDETPSSGFLGVQDASPPAAVLEATDQEDDLRSLSMVMANFGLGFIGLASCIEIGYGIVTINSKHVINGTKLMMQVMIGYVMINNILSAGLGADAPF